MTEEGATQKRTRKLLPQDKKLANRIRELREKKGLSQIQLSLLISSGKDKANTNYIAFIENHKRGLSLPTLYKIAKALGVEVRELFTF